MELRKLKKGEQVLVIGNCGDPPFSIGKTYIVRREDGTSGAWLGESGWIYRKDILAIGDKVVRGPDWERWEDGSGTGPYGPWKPTCEGTVSKLCPDYAEVKWEDGTHRRHRMTPDHQDLKPTGDSVDEGKSKSLREFQVGDTVKSTPTGYTGVVTEVSATELWYKDSEDGQLAWNHPKNFTLLHEVKSKGKPECFGYSNCSLVDCDDCPRSNRSSVGQHASCQCSNAKCAYTSACAEIHKSVHAAPVKEPISGRIYTDKPSFKDQENTTMSNTTETFDRLERANHIKLVEKPKAENKIAAATEELELLKDEMDILLECPTLHSEKIKVLALCADKDPAISAKATIRALELGLPVTINVKS